jgi:glutamyl-tRNA reductase
MDTLLTVGAGTIGRQAVHALQRAGCPATLLSRTTSPTGSSGARPGPKVHPLEELEPTLAWADLVFVATSAGRRVLPAQLIDDVLQHRQDRPLTIVDLALPRNVDPGVGRLAHVRLLDLDDLSDRSSGVDAPPAALARVEASIAAAAADCGEIRSRRAGPLITALRARVTEICADQLRRTSKGLDMPEHALARMAWTVAGTVAHGPILLARQAAAHNDTNTLVLLATAFGLDTDGSETITCPQPRRAR